jgi:microtubule-associated protein-like 1/2
MSRQDSKLSINSNISSRWREDLQNYQAIKVTIYKNGDQWFDGMELRFKPQKEYKSLDALFNKLNPRIDFTTAVNYLFDTDGNMVRRVEDLEDGQSYVASNSKKFLPANYGRKGEAFWLNGYRHPPYRSYRRRSASSKSSSSDGKPGSGDGKVIKIINNEDTSIIERVLLNLKTSQSFEDVIKDLGQVLKIPNADRMYSLSGREVKSFSHLRHDFFDEDVFAISSGATKVDKSIYQMSRHTSASSSSRRSTRLRSGASSSTPKRELETSSGNLKILINGVRKIYHPPGRLPREDNRPPGRHLHLEWVHGYRGTDRFNNLVVLHKGEIVYYVGSVAVIMYIQEDTQRHYVEHNEDIQCIALHPRDDFIATGQIDGKDDESRSHIRIWSVTTLETVTVLGHGELENGVLSVAFSALNKGQYLAAVDGSIEHVLSVWDWDKGELLARVVTNVIRMCGVTFHPFDNNLIITHGTGHLCFWSRRKDSFFERVDVAEKEAPNVTFQAIDFMESGDLIVGDSNGFISSYSVTDEGEYFRSLHYAAHSKEITSILMMVEGTLISASAKDRKLRAWDTHLDFKKVAENELPAPMGAAVAMAQQWPGRSDANVYIGTDRNIIVEGSLQKRFEIVTFGHISKINGVATCPNDVSFVTVGSDRLIACWRRTKLIWKQNSPVEPLCIGYNPQGTVVAAGLSDGNMVILKAETGDHVTTARVCGSAITAIRFCLDGDLVACASHNGSIYLYKVSRDGFSYKKHGKLTGGQLLANLDWDESSEYIQTCSTDYNLNFWNANTNRMEKVGSLLREKVWLNQTCPVGWAVAGLWNNHNYKEDTILTSVNVSQNNELVASGDTAGYIRLSRWPTLSPKAEFHEIKVASHEISALKFFYDDSYVVGTGGMEGGIYKFRIL